MLTRPEIYRIVNDFIGVSGGYLGDFSYRTHREFYPSYCDLDVDVVQYEPGTTRDKFIRILTDASPVDQAKIISGLFRKYPSPAPPDSEPERRATVRREMQKMVQRLQGSGAVPAPRAPDASATVARALRDAEELMSSQGAVSCVDRIHTALHGYVRELCTRQGITVPPDASLSAAFTALRRGHPAFSTLGHTSGHIETVLRSLAAVIGALEPIRSRGSVAHPNEQLVEEPEAMLVVNTGHTLY